MTGTVGFLLKVLLLSAGVSLLIKYGGPHLAIPPTVGVSLALILTPSLIVAAVLIVQAQRRSA
ncbi:hypothetical protein IQ241_04955 [Romeria aff. gracilis LEGE 07310]|uniref:Uncharacterized protein n=2 Tax=Vasconcelosia TaxID=3366328 RepID=A0A8J7ALY3_9CYAN|nr:hypothetical protein [Romeria aff. gracilis LEGE 07310]